MSPVPEINFAPGEYERGQTWHREWTAYLARVLEQLYGTDESPPVEPPDGFGPSPSEALAQVELQRRAIERLWARQRVLYGPLG